MRGGFGLPLGGRLRTSVAAAALGLLVTSCAAPPSDIGHDGPPPLRDGSAQYVIEDPAWIPGPMPLLTRGGTSDLRAFRGRVVLLNFWATWCVPCVTEMPALDRLQGALGGARFTVVAVSIERNAMDRVAAFVEHHRLTHLSVFMDDSNDSADGFKLYGLPTSFIIDRSGRVRGYLVGAVDWDSDEARSLVRYYLRRQS